MSKPQVKVDWENRMRAKLIDKLTTQLAALRKDFGAFSLKDYIERQREWSRNTFGPGRRTMGVTGHIEKELAEIRNAPGDLEEWVDVVILALDGAWRAGHTPYEIVAMMQAKQVKNMARRWPAETDEDKPVEHVRECGAGCVWVQPDSRAQPRFWKAGCNRVVYSITTMPKFCPVCGRSVEVKST
jgi:hypothetical protein